MSLFTKRNRFSREGDEELKVLDKVTTKCSEMETLVLLWRSEAITQGDCIDLFKVFDSIHLQVESHLTNINLKPVF